MTDMRPWGISAHARERGAEFGYSYDDIQELLSRHPSRIVPDSHSPNRVRRIYDGECVLVVNPRERIVITLLPDTAVQVRGRNYVQRWEHR